MQAWVLYSLVSFWAFLSVLIVSSSLPVLVPPCFNCYSYIICLVNWDSDCQVGWVLKSHFTNEETDVQRKQWPLEDYTASKQASWESNLSFQIPLLSTPLELLSERLSHRHHPSIVQSSHTSSSPLISQHS